MTRTVIAHDSAPIRQILRTALDTHGIRVLAACDSMADVIETCYRHAPDVVMSGLQFRDGPLHARLAAVLKTSARLLVVCDAPADDNLRETLLAGASGCISLHDPRPAEIAHAVHAVAKGHAVLHPAAAAAVLQQWRAAQQRADPPTRMKRALTRREVQVLETIVDGLTTATAARRLGIAAKTVESHKARIFDKLGTRNQAEAVATALRRGLLENK